MPNTKPRPAIGQEVILFTVAETAKRMGECSDMHVYRQIDAGELRAVDIATPGSGRAKLRIRSDDLADYIERKTAGTASRRVSAGGA